MILFIPFSLFIKHVTAVKLFYYECIMILLLLRYYAGFTFYSIHNYDNLFCIIENYAEICGNALKLIKSYVSHRTQRVIYLM